MTAQSEAAVDTARDPSRPWVVAAVVLAAGAGVALMIAPLVETASGSGSVRQSLLEREGLGTAALLLVPALIAAVPLPLPRRHRGWATIGSAALLVVGALISVASVGLFYLPGAALAAVAAVRARPRRSAEAT